ncbi:hypothetical protein P168DRAFT_315214 [Aspergillus campestris IBT 28561]|uniref:Crh-like protein n=1 Tax=Aspergillus campestris (strain IBT 28561) TaxID=1392248 RepID=A0A2I1DH44_ASPC2|nr:uncharacterized protein P168DRAFT_315214 [Aspergillus campestris IBT 28561]PKY09194.1 hypothetical protein P168DRAFT_315214 [Aspergillus campestris IBT 28561]
MFFKYATAALAALAPLASAQTFTECDPLKKTCPNDKGLDTSSYEADFTKGESALDKWKTQSKSINFGDQGMELTIDKQGDHPTVATEFYIFFGKVEVEMKAAPGTGIVSTIVLESDVLDEIDWETLGGDTTQIQTNYFGKGDHSSYDRGSFADVDRPQETFHTYTVEYNKDAMTWSIDGNVIRTVAFQDAKGGSRFPQTPMRVKIGTWAGGDPDNDPGTIEWAGGETDYSAAPFTAYIKSVKIENDNPASEYSYSDNSGSFESIKKEGGKDDSDDDDDDDEDSSSTSSSSSSTSSSTSTTSSSKEESTSSDEATTTGESASSPTGSSAASKTEDSDGASATGPGSGSGSGSHSGSGSPSGSPSGGASTPSPSSFNSAAPSRTSMDGSSLALVILGLFTAMLQF